MCHALLDGRVHVQVVHLLPHVLDSLHALFLVLDALLSMFGFFFSLFFELLDLWDQLEQRREHHRALGEAPEHLVEHDGRPVALERLALKSEADLFGHLAEYRQRNVHQVGVWARKHRLVGRLLIHRLEVLDNLLDGIRAEHQLLFLRPAHSTRDVRVDILPRGERGDPLHQLVDDRLLRRNARLVDLRLEHRLAPQQLFAYRFWQ